jgi:hypothetical protein
MQEIACVEAETARIGLKVASFRRTDMRGDLRITADHANSLALV